MALDLGELNIRLQLENDHFRAGLAATKRDLETIPPAARREMVKVGRVMDEEGRKSGGLLAQGVRSGFMRNSPLIVAGIGAALAAGAPVMIAAAGTLFAGVGAAAAAQTVEVRSAWTELGRDIRDGAVEDAAVLVPVYTQMADEIGAAFQRLRPQLRETFADSAPLIQSFTGGVVALAENAMPGLVRAVAAGQPVFAGLEHFLAATGTGLSDFFDAINGHAPAAGSVFASLGDIMGDLLPILGELIGQGAELAADVLPAVAAATGLTLDVLQLLGPMLPGIVTGFVAFKAAQTAAGYLQTFAVQAQYATIAMTGSVTAGTKVGGVLAGLGKSLPAVGIGVGVVASAMAQGEAQVDGWARGLLEGGAAAQTVRDDIAGLADTWGGWRGTVASFAPGMAGVAGALGDAGNAMEAAEQRAQELYDAMSPLQQAEQDVTTATNVLSEKLDKYGAGSREAEGAARELEAAERERERQSAALELAIHGVTSAMIEQAEQALASIDSGFAYRKSLDDLEDAQANLNTAIAQQGAGSEAAQRAQLALEEQAYNTALAFGQQQADLSGLSSDSLEYKRLIQEQMLVELYRLRDAAGPEMKGAIDAQIAALQAGGVALSASAQLAANLRGQMGELSGSIHEVPGQKFVKIDAPTEEQKQRLRDLGYTVTTLPDGSIFVSADTAAAEAAIAWAARARRMTITVDTIGGSGVRLGSGMLGGTVLRASGGPVYGPGGPTDDLVPATGPSGSRYALSNDEHIVTAAEVRAAGGHGAVLGIRQAMLAGAFRRAAGGPVASGTGGTGEGLARYIDRSTTHVYAQVDARRLAREMENERRDREFLAGVS